LYRNRLLAVAIVFFVSFFRFASADLAPQAEKTTVVNVIVRGEIDGGQVALVHRAMEKAIESKAAAFIVEIDTFGGLVDAAVQIRDMVADAPLNTICFVKNRAWSAGALIAIAHRHIAIAPGGSIGAAEPIPTTEKTVAALKAEFAATANKSGRDPRVAEAMVDKSLGYPGYAAPGQILALTDYQAVKVGYADVVAPDLEAVLAHFALAGAEVVTFSQTWQDKIVGFLANPTVRSILLTIAFLAILAEIKTAGLGVAALTGLAAAALFFAGQWLTGLGNWLEILLFLAGVGFIVAEMFIPGTGVLAFIGIICILGSFFLSLGANLAALNVLAVSLIAAFAIFLLLVRRLPSSRLWSRLILKDAETTQAGFVSAQDYSEYLGKEGVAKTMLRPAGVAEIGGIQLDVVSEGQFVPQGTKIKVVSVSGSRIVVRPVV